MFDLTATLAAMAVTAAILGLAFWQAHRPRKDSIRARWIPWRFVMLLAGAALVILLVHVVNLMGVRTGNPPVF